MDSVKSLIQGSLYQLKAPKYQMQLLEIFVIFVILAGCIVFVSQIKKKTLVIVHKNFLADQWVRRIKGGMNDELVVVTAGGKLVRSRIKEISVIGRNTQGMRVIRMGDNNKNFPHFSSILSSSFFVMLPFIIISTVFSLPALNSRSMTDM